MMKSTGVAGAWCVWSEESVILTEVDVANPAIAQAELC